MKIATLGSELRVKISVDARDLGSSIKKAADKKAADKKAAESK